MFMTSVAPRYGAVPSGVSRGSGGSVARSSFASAAATQGYRPRYCAAPAKYFTTSPILPATVSPYGGRPLPARPNNSRYFDPSYPSRQFGSRLSKTYSAAHLRPQLYDEFYGTSLLPGYGTDSWSAYKISDAAIDDGEDIAYLSRRRDYETLRGVELAMQLPAPSTKRTRARLHQLALLARHGEPYKHALMSKNTPRPAGRAMSVPPLTSGSGVIGSAPCSGPPALVESPAGSAETSADWPAPRLIRNVMPSYMTKVLRAKIDAAAKVKSNAAFVPPRPVARASSVPPKSRVLESRYKSKTVRPIRSAKPVASNARGLAAARSVENLSYGYGYNTEPKVKVVYETVPRGRDLLTAKEKLLSREVIDLESPSGTMALKMRIADAKAMLDQQGAMLGRYHQGGCDADMMQVEEEVRRVKSQQALRAKSVVN